MIRDEVMRGKQPQARLRESARLARLNKASRDWYLSGQYNSDEALAEEIVQTLIRQAALQERWENPGVWGKLMDAVNPRRAPFWSNNEKIVDMVFKKLYKYQGGPADQVYVEALKWDLAFFKELMKRIPVPVQRLVAITWENPDIFVQLAAVGLVDPEQHKYPVTVDWIAALRTISIDLMQRPDLQDGNGLQYSLSPGEMQKAFDLGEDFYNAYLPPAWKKFLSETTVEGLEEFCRRIDWRYFEKAGKVVEPVTVKQMSAIPKEKAYDDWCYVVRVFFERLNIPMEPEVVRKCAW